MTGPVQSDGVMARRAQGGDEAAFAVLANRYARPALAAAFSVLGDIADAEDAVQDALVLAWDRLHQCRDPERFGGWFFTIVRRTALKRSRKIRTLREVGLAAHEPATGADEGMGPFLRAELREHLANALATLSPGQRQVLLLYDLEGWRHGEIASALGMTEVMSRRHLSDARRRMRTALGGDPEEFAP